MGVKGRQQKQFYAAIIWNYNSDKYECMVVTQSTIKQPIYNATVDPDWGDHTGYDFIITRTGQELQTAYTVMPKPPSDFHLDTSDLIYSLEELYKGGNPLGDD